MRRHGPVAVVVAGGFRTEKHRTSAIESVVPCLVAVVLCEVARGAAVVTTAGRLRI